MFISKDYLSNKTKVYSKKSTCVLCGKPTNNSICDDCNFDMESEVENFLKDSGRYSMEIGGCLR